METKSDLITYCLTYKDVYEDYPFRDHEWTVIRHRGNKRVFAWIYRREGQGCINLKCGLNFGARPIPVCGQGII